jgi:hypothetical protein
MDENDVRKEVRHVRRMLEEIARLAEHASLTGSLEGGARSAVKRYNAMVARLKEIGAVPDAMLQPLDETASFDELCVESELLAGYLNEDNGDEPEAETRRSKHLDFEMIVGLAPFLDQKELRELVRAAVPGRKSVNPRLVIGLAPFLGREELGRLIREHLPEWFRGQEEEEEEPSPPKPSHAPLPSEEEGPLADVGARMQAVAEQLRRADLTDAQRADLAEQLSRLSQEQARLARQRAARREAEGDTDIS